MSAARGNMCTHEEAAKFSPRENKCEAAMHTLPIFHTPYPNLHFLQFTDDRILPQRRGSKI